MEAAAASGGAAICGSMRQAMTRMQAACMRCTTRDSSTPSAVQPYVPASSLPRPHLDAEVIMHLLQHNHVVAGRHQAAARRLHHRRLQHCIAVGARRCQHWQQASSQLARARGGAGQQRGTMRQRRRHDSALHERECTLRQGNANVRQAWRRLVQAALDLCFLLGRLCACGDHGMQARAAAAAAGSCAGGSCGGTPPTVPPGAT